jgi:hypothetical protein
MLPAVIERISPTPGPWKAWNDQQHGPVVYSGSRIVAIIIDGDRTTKEAISNAILISAVHDLLEACKSALQRLKEYEIVNDYHHPLVRQLERAIRKAEVLP